MTTDRLLTTDYLVTRGDSLTIELGPFELEENDGAGNITTVPVDLLVGGTKLWLTVKRSHDDADADAVLQLTETAGITRNEPAGADHNYALARIAEGALDFPRRTALVWDLQYQLGDRTETLLRGTITVVPDVTRAS